MDIRPIRCDDDLTWALAEIGRYFDDPPAKGTPEADRFDVLCTLVSAYEAEAFPIPPAEPVDVLRLAISDMGRTQAELADILGSRSRASEVLAGKRRMTVEMIRAVSDAWTIPIDALVPRIVSRDAA